MSVQRFGTELPLVMITLWLQSAGVAVLIAWVRRALQGDMQQIGALRSAALIVRFTAAVVVLHGMEILLWACSIAGGAYHHGIPRSTSPQAVIQRSGVAM
jgi:hypothetical protein